MQDYLRSRLELANSDDFELLRRLPSTTVWRTLGYFRSLKDAERSQFLETCAGIARQWVAEHKGTTAGTATPVSPRVEQTPAETLYTKIFSDCFWSDTPDRFMRQYGEEILATMVGESRRRAIMALEVPTIAKAGAIRSVLHRRLKETFAAKVENGGGGEWLCEGSVDDRPFRLGLDYGGMGSGFRYSVAFASPAAVADYRGGWTLESSYGFPTGICDFPVADELDELAGVVCDIIVDLSQFHSSMERIG